VPANVIGATPGRWGYQHPILDEPDKPEQMATPIDIKTWELDLKEHRKKVESRKTNSDLVYALILGQCSQAMRNRLEAHEAWATDVIGLLEMLQQCMGEKATHQYPIQMQADAEERVYAFWQMRNMTDHQYFDKFTDLIETACRLGSTIRFNQKRVDDILVRILAVPGQPRPSKKARAQKMA